MLALAGAGCGGLPDAGDAGLPPDFDMTTTLPGGDGGIACGSSDCLVGNELVCCLDNALRYCAPAGACSAPPAWCDGPEDCPGAACCQPNGTMMLVCRVQCAGTVVCHGDGDCPATQPRCCPGLANGYGGCASSC
jgi:hypothetical protein